ncbi:MAG: TetR/AcrR family transcriptional regulator [Bacteroidales bacterium]
MSPRSAKQFEEIREEKITLIMDTALEHFANEGFHATTINHIAKHAGISKGLLYNYFKSKEELLIEIIRRSVVDIYGNIDPNGDGIISEDEFEQFIRRFATLLREKRLIWRLFYQLIMQKDVYEIFINSYFVKGTVTWPDSSIQDHFLSNVTSMIKDYFERKKERMPADWDHNLDLEMFVHTLKGFSLTSVFLDEVDETMYWKTVNRIIETYK